MEVVLKELWECWKVYHNMMIEKAERGDDSGRVLGGWCNEIKEMMLWIVESVEIECDDEINGIVEILVVMEDDS